MTRDVALALIHAERDRQEAEWAGVHRWGSGSCSSVAVATIVKSAVLQEECGEVARAVLDDEPANLLAELTQVAAVALAWMESIE